MRGWGSTQAAPLATQLHVLTRLLAARRSLMKRPKDELKQMLRDRGMPVSGLKAELAKRLVGALTHRVGCAGRWQWLLAALGLCLECPKGPRLSYTHMRTFCTVGSGAWRDIQ